MKKVIFNVFKDMDKKIYERLLGPIDTLRQVLSHADAVVIGAGAGLSTSAGFTYDRGAVPGIFLRFCQQVRIYGYVLRWLYPYPTMEEYWAYWSRYIYINRYQDAPKPVYQGLFSLVKDKDYFVLTTNVDHCFQKAGFDKKRLFYTQGITVCSSAVNRAVRKHSTMRNSSGRW